MKQLEITGLMLDMARVTERFEHYMQMAQAIPAWGYNTIFAHATDNEGCAIIFDSHPELASPHALTKAQVREWIAATKGAGASIIPEIECFGHTQFIHNHPKYKHLAMPTTGHFNAINPLHPDTHTILNDLLKDTAELFDSPYIHAGFDEVNLGDRSVLGEPAAGKEDWEIFADMVNLVHGMIEKLGKRMMIWGDHLVSEPRIASRISKDIIVCDWQYHADLSTRTTDTLLELGFEVMCCPASARSGDMFMPRANTLGNLQRFARIAHSRGGRVLGLSNTVWCPGRLLCGTELFAYALGGAWFNNPEADAAEVMSKFVTERYGIGEQADELAEALLDLSTLIPHNSLPRRIMQTETSHKAPPSPITFAEARTMGQIAKQVAKLRPVLEAYHDRATQNPHEFANYLLVCDLIAWLDRLAGFRVEGEPSASRSQIVDEGSKLLDRCCGDWSRRRFDDDPYRDNDPYPEEDGLITNLQRSLAELQQSQGAAAPDREVGALG